MSIVETVDLIASITNIDEEIDKYTDIFQNYKTMDLDEIYNKSRKLLLLYFYNDNIEKVNILMEFIFVKIIDESKTIFTIEEFTIQLNLMLIYIENLLKLDIHSTRIAEYCKKSIDYNKIVNCPYADLNITKISAIIHQHKQLYVETEQTLQSLIHIADDKYKYDLYITIIQLYSELDNKEKMNEYFWLSVNIINDVFDNVHSKIYSYIYCINICSDLHEQPLTFINISYDLLYDHYDNNMDLVKKDPYYYKLYKCKCLTELYKHNYVNILIQIDEIIELSKKDKEYQLWFYVIKIDCLLGVNKPFEAYKIVSQIDSDIINFQIQLLKYKYYVSKFHLAIKLADEQLFISIINVIINHESKVNGFEMRYYKYPIIKQNIPLILCLFRSKCKDIIQTCECGLINTSKGKHYKSFTLCKKCKACRFCSKTCQQKFKKSHAKKCKSII